MRRALLVTGSILAAVAVGIAIGALVVPDGGSPAPIATITVTTPAGPDGAGEARSSTRDLAQIAASLPKGFTVGIAADKLPYSTTFALDGRGGLYLGVLDADGTQVMRLSDGDGDGVMEHRTTFARVPSLVSGFLVRPDGVLIAVRGSILLATDRDRDGRADSLRPWVRGLPVSSTIKIHSNNGMAYGPDGRIYFGLGATCNACFEQDPRSATIMSCDASGGDCRVFARGFRNAWDVAFDPSDGSLWAGDNGPDAVGGAVIEPQDEVNRVRRGLDYGSPFCWGKERGLACDGTEPATVEVEPHAAPAGLAFTTGTALPPDYRNNLFVTLWGGRRVIRVVPPAPGSSAGAKTADFVSLDRPVDVIQDVDGSLFVLDSDAARIYRITYGP